MLEVLPDVYQKFLSKICNLISQKRYQQAEKIVLGALENILKHKYNQKEKREKDIIFLEALYTDFNDYYCKWLVNKGKEEEAENCRNITWKNQYHFFINNCKDPAMMDNLFWKVGGYLVSRKNNINIQEIHYGLEEYKKLHTY